MALEEKKRILIVDDEENIRGLLNDILAEEYSVTIASDGKEALTQLEQEPYDLMITDIVMPEKEGIETMLAAFKKYENLKIIAMSGVANKRQYLLAASFLGAQEVLQKPFTVNDVKATVKRILE